MNNIKIIKKYINKIIPKNDVNILTLSFKLEKNRYVFEVVYGKELCITTKTLIYNTITNEETITKEVMN